MRIEQSSATAVPLGASFIFHAAHLYLTVVTSRYPHRRIRRIYCERFPKHARLPDLSPCLTNPLRIARYLLPLNLLFYFNNAGDTAKKGERRNVPRWERKTPPSSLSLRRLSEVRYAHPDNPDLHRSWVDWRFAQRITCSSFSTDDNERDKQVAYTCEVDTLSDRSIAQLES